MIPLSHYLIVGALLFATSIVGIFLNRKNLVIILMAIELLLLAANMNFVAFSHYLEDLSGQVFVFFVLTVAAAEAAIGQRAARVGEAGEGGRAGVAGRAGTHACTQRIITTSRSPYVTTKVRTRSCLRYL